MFVGSKLQRWFLITAGVLLLLTGLAKVISCLGRAGILQSTDPLFNVKFRDPLLLTGLLEVSIATLCLLKVESRVKVLLIAWLATTFGLYRLALSILGWHGACPCLGNFVDMLHVSPVFAHQFTNLALAYLIVGSYGILILSGRQEATPNRAPV